MTTRVCKNISIYYAYVPTSKISRTKNFTFVNHSQNNTSCCRPPKDMSSRPGMTTLCFSFAVQKPCWVIQLQCFGKFTDPKMRTYSKRTSLKCVLCMCVNTTNEIQNTNTWPIINSSQIFNLPQLK